MQMKNEIRQLIRKLEEHGDISLREADWIFSLFSANSLKTKLNPASFKADKSLMEALKKWFAVVASKIEQGYSGNFIFTILLPNGAPDHLGFGGFRNFIQAALSDAEKNLAIDTLHHREIRRENSADEKNAEKPCIFLRYKLLQAARQDNNGVGIQKDGIRAVKP